MFGTLEAGWGLEVVIWLQANGHPLLDAIATFFAFAGGSFAYLFVLPLIFWTIDRQLGRWLLVVLVTAIFVVVGGKELFDRPRPFQYDAESVMSLVEASGNGFPSGHVGVSLAIWGFVALWAQRWWGYALVFIYIVIMGWARMYTGVHYPQDVAGGLLVGSAVAPGIYRLRGPLERAWARLPSALSFLLLLALGVLMAFLLRDDEVGLVAAGLLIGGGWGGLMAAFGTFAATGSLLQRGLRFVVGITLTLAVFIALDLAFRPLEPDAAFHVVQYTLVALVILGLYPLTLARTGFTQPDDSEQA